MGTRAWGAAAVAACSVGAGLLGAAPAVAHPLAGAADPTVLAQDTVTSHVFPGRSVDTVLGSDSRPGEHSWFLVMQSRSAVDLSSPSISVDAVSPSWTFTDPALPSLPITQTGATLPAGQDFPGSHPFGDWADFPLDVLSNGVSTAITTGYDVSRTLVSPSDDLVPPGGATQTWSFTLTLRDPRFANGSLFMSVTPNDCCAAGPAVIDTGTLVDPVLGNGEGSQRRIGASPGGVEWDIWNAVLNKPYTATLQVHVPNDGTSAFPYKPFLFGFANANAVPLADTSGTSTSIADPDLGGTVTYSVGEPVTWQHSLTAGWSVFLASTPVPPVELTPPAQVNVHVGSTANASVGVAAVDGFSGQVNLSLSGTPDDFGNWTQPPQGLSANVAGPVSVPPTATVSVGIEAQASVAPGIYHVYLFAESGSGRRTSTPLTVVVLPPLPRGQAEVQNFDRASFPGSVDSVGGSDPLVGTADWYADIFDFPFPVPLVLPGATITAASSTQQFQPSVSFPAVTGPTAVAPNDFIQLALTGAQNIHFTTGFDASRSSVPSNWILPPGGGTELVTVTFTPTVAAGSAILQVITPYSPIVSSSIETGNITLGGFGPGELEFEDIQGGIATIGVGPQVGHTYSVTVPVDVGSGGLFKPLVSVTTDTFTSAPTSIGPSVTIPDAAFGGSFVFSSSSDAVWDTFVDRGATANFDSVVPTELTQLQGLLQQVNALVPGASRRDAPHVRDAARALAAAVAPSLWSADGNSLDPRRGALVFVDLAQAAQALSGVGGTQSTIHAIVATGRSLARQALDATTSRAGEAAFALAERAAARGQSAAALALYGVAWRLAVS
jgi:hypothetical protein